MMKLEKVIIISRRFRVIDGGETEDERDESETYSLEQIAETQRRCSEGLEEIGIAPFGYAGDEKKESGKIYGIIEISKRSVTKAKRYLRDKIQNTIKENAGGKPK